MKRLYQGGRDVVELAYRARVSTSTIYGFVNGSKQTRKENVERICKAAAKASMRLPDKAPAMWVF